MNIGKTKGKSWGQTPRVLPRFIDAGVVRRRRHFGKTAFGRLLCRAPLRVATCRRIVLPSLPTGLPTCLSTDAMQGARLLVFLSPFCYLALTIRHSFRWQRKLDEQPGDGLCCAPPGQILILRLCACFSTGLPTAVIGRHRRWQHLSRLMQCLSSTCLQAYAQSYPQIEEKPALAGNYAGQGERTRRSVIAGAVSLANRQVIQCLFLACTHAYPTCIDRFSHRLIHRRKTGEEGARRCPLAAAARAGKPDGLPACTAVLLGDRHRPITS